MSGLDLGSPGVHEETDQERGPGLPQGVSHHEVDGLGERSPRRSDDVAEKLERIKTFQAGLVSLHRHVHGHGPVEVEKDHADTDDDKTENDLLLGYQNTRHEDGKAELNCLSWF